MKNKYEIVAMFANDFGKAFDFVRKETIDECVEVVKTEVEIVVGGGEHATNIRQRMVDKMRKL